MQIFLTFGYFVLTFTLDISKIEWKWDENKAIKLPVNVHCLHDAMHSGSLEKDVYDEEYINSLHS